MSRLPSFGFGVKQNAQRPNQFQSHNNHPRPTQPPSNIQQQQQPITFPFSNFNPQALPDIPNTNPNLIDDYSETDSDSTTPQTTTTTTITFGLSKAPIPPPPLPPIPQGPQSTFIPFADTIGDLKHQLDPGLLSRLPKDTSDASWAEWLAERRHRYPKIKRTDRPAEITDVPTMTDGGDNEKLDGKTTGAGFAGLIDDYSDSDDDAPAIPVPLQRSGPSKSYEIKSSISMTDDTLTVTLHEDDFVTQMAKTKEERDSAIKQQQLKLSGALTIQIDPIHTPERNSVTTNQEILKNRYKEYLLYLGIHSGIVHFLTSYPPSKLPIFPLLAPRTNDGRGGDMGKGGKFGKDKWGKKGRGDQNDQNGQNNGHNDQNDDGDAKSNAMEDGDCGGDGVDGEGSLLTSVPTTALLSVSDFPRRRHVDLLKCTTPDNPFISLCLTLHGQYGYQQYQLYKPFQREDGSIDQSINANNRGRDGNNNNNEALPTATTTTTTTTSNNNNPTSTNSQPRSTPLQIETILEKCHKRIVNGDFSQSLPPPKGGKGDKGGNWGKGGGNGSKFQQFKDKRREFLNSNGPGADSSSRTNIAYVDLYKKLISQDLANEQKVIMRALNSLRTNEYFPTGPGV